MKDRPAKPSEIRAALFALGERGNRLAEENERLSALLVKALDAIQPTRDGKRDGGTFGKLSQVSDDIKAALAGRDSKG